MTQRQGRALLGSVAGRSAAGGLLPSDTVNIIQSLGPSFTVGAFQGIDPADLIILSGRTTNTNLYTSLQTTMGGTGLNGATGYTVPAGRQLIIGGLMYALGVASDLIVIGYGDTSVIDAAGAPTNAVGLTSRALKADVATKTYQWTLALKIPAGKIPYMFSTGGTGSYEVIAFGKLFTA